MTRRLYWAYGSNLSVAKMRQRCPAAKKGSQLIVSDAALVFRDVADVTIRKGSIVPGGLWHITPECEEHLDRVEGVRSNFYLKRYLPIRFGNRVRKVLFYQMRWSRGVMPPSEEYADTIAQGYRDFDLDRAWLDRAILESYEEKHVTRDLVDRQWRKGRRRLARRPVLPVGSGSILIPRTV